MALQVRWYGGKGGTLLENSFHLRCHGSISALDKIFVKFPKIGLAENVNQNLNAGGCFSHHILAQLISVNLGHKGPRGPNDEIL